MKKILILSIVMLIIPGSLSISNPFRHDEHIVIDEWYPISQWEVDVCNKYGGQILGDQAEISSVDESFYMFLTTVTLQGQQSVQILPEGGNITIYEYAWYFRPMDNDQKYKVEVIGTSGTRKIYEATASRELGESNYHAEESTEVYEKVKITYESGSLMVPIVPK